MPPNIPDGAIPSSLFEDHYQRIYRYALGLMRDPVEADDVTQETFLRAYQRLDSLRDPAALTTWLYRIATNAGLDRIRQRARRAPVEAEVDPADVDEADLAAPSLQQLVEQSEMGECVQRYLESLSD